MKISVKVRAQSGKNEVVEKSPGNFLVHTTKPAQKGAANRAVVKLLSKHLGIAQSRISICQGSKTSNKIVEVE